MALLTTRGFDDRSLLARPETYGTWLPIVDSISVAGRFGGFCVNSSNSGAVLFTLAAAASTLIVGGAHKGTSVASEGDHYVQLISAAGAQLTVLAPNSTTLELRRGGSTGTVIGTAQFVAGTWNFIELKATLDDVSGTAIIRCNGVEVINFTGDTRNSGSDTTWTQVSFDAGNNHATIDDIYICDGAGLAPYNNFLGDVKVETIVPTGNGNSSQLVGSDGNSTDNYLLVDEIPVSLTDYVGSSTIGQKDTYGFSNLTTGSGQILSVQTSARVFKSDAGAANMKVVERAVSGTERESASVPVTASPGILITTAPQTTDPDGAAWTIASVNAAEFGVKVD